MVKKKKDLDYYLRLPFTEVLRPDDEGDFVARIAELQGCVAHGDTKAKALENLQTVKELWIQDAFENGDPIPEPEVETALPSGKWVQRVPRSLHKKLVALAKREGTSLNQLVVSVLSACVGASAFKDEQKIRMLETRGQSIDLFRGSPLQYRVVQNVAVSSESSRQIQPGAEMKALGERKELRT